MLATHNLQFSPVEITDDSVPMSVSTPEAAPTAEFAELLRLRVDTATSVSPGGETLPEGGSDLPLQAIPIELESLPTSELSVLPQAEPALADLTSEPLLPWSSAAEGVAPRADTVTIAATPVIKAPDLETAVADRRDQLNSADARPLSFMSRQVFQPAPVANVQDTAAPLQATVDLKSPELRERPLPGPAQLVVPEADKNIAVPDLPRRVETSPLAVAGTQEISDLFKARPTVTQPVQVLNTQPNPQQAALTPPPTAAPAADTGYAAAVQQANDLISIPVRNTAWGDQIGERVLMMAGNQMKTAEIRLTPAELGPLRVQVSVDDGAANVTFQAQHAVTREAIEQALPRLRELLAENGLSLGQANVGEQGVAEGNREEPSNALRSDEGSDDSLDGAPQDENFGTQRPVRANSLVDTFA